MNTRISFQDAEIKTYTFEEAMDQTGFGLFNIALLLLGILCTSAVVFQTLVMSFIVPSAECDLELNIEKKGILISVVFIGMIISAIPWGFLADTHGRKSVLVGGFLINGIIVLCASACRKYKFLVVEMFLVGLAISGPYDCFMTYIAEMNPRGVRSRVMLAVGFFLILATFFLSGLSMLILPQQWSVTILSAKFYSWQIFIMATAVPSFLAGTCFIFFPESPKFLMAIGYDSDALKILQTIYALNKFKARKTFQVKLTTNYRLRQQRESVYSRSVVNAYDLMKSFFTRKLAMMSWKIFLVAFSILMCVDTIRLWMPQFFVTLAKFKTMHEGKSRTWCNIVESIVADSKISDTHQTQCIVHIRPQSYANNFFICGASMIGFILALLVVNKVGPQILLIISLLISSSASFALYWVQGTVSIIFITSICIAAGSIGRMVVVYLAITLFPTSMRAVIVAFTMTCGRIGCVLGNFMFPVMLELGCLVPLLWWSLVGLCKKVACGLSSQLPNPR